MTQRFRNPKRNLPREHKPYVPEHRRLKISPILMNDEGRVEEPVFEQPPYGGLPLNVGQSEVTYQLDGQEADFDDDEEEYPMPNYQQPPPRYEAPRASRPSRSSDISPGEFIVLVKGQVIASGPEDKVIQIMTNMLYKQEINLEDVVLLQRMEVNFGISIR